MRSSGEICDDARCQVYVGATAESPGQDAAVAATARKVLTYGGQLAAAVYSADAGGVSANTFEGFGTPDGVYPYLRNVAYETDNPLPWHLVVAFDELARRFGYGGTVTGARVGETGPSGRALQVVLEGTAGDKVVDGRTFARGLGLRSTRFTAKVGTSDGSPVPPPPAEEAIQLLPEETAEAALAPVSSSSEVQLERSDAVAPAAGGGGALDPGRHPATLVAVLLLAAVAGAHLPVALARSRRPVRTSGWWSSLIRSP
jgi:SpoIID/LytB domain protein